MLAVGCTNKGDG
ncbi:hypothetical protein LIER_35927 [Lithospermum erythrorhizon]|uniref:Uncharacterized protein n=1 Tax=Lithospermum erythrorhizon TaxID=34254 RepID=A0AAV3NZJ6_LITER